MQKINFYLNAQQIKKLENANKLELDLTSVKIIDTEAIKFLIEESNLKDVILRNPPDILFQILDILELRDVFFNKIRIIY